MPVDKYQNIGRLLSKVCRSHATRADQYMDRLGLFRGQAILLLILAEHDALTHSAIARILCVSPAAATKVIKRMEENEYLKRQSDPKDDRISRVVLQEKGRALVNEIRSSFGQLDRMMLKDIPEDDLRKFREILIKIQQNLQSSVDPCNQEDSGVEIH